MANAATLAYEVYEGFQSKKETVIAALDLEDAYNRVSYVRLITLLLEDGIDQWLVRWIAVVLLSRKVALRCGTWVSSPHEITPGLPQGSPISSVMFNVYTAQIARIQGQGPGRTLTFADDILTYQHGSDRETMARNLQGCLEEMTAWCDENNAVINPAKAKVLWCGMDNNIVNDEVPALECSGEVVERDHELRYLGVVFDRSLSFNRHVDSIAQKAKKGVAAIKVMANADTQQKILVLLVQMLVLSVMDYGLGLLTLSQTQI